MATPVQQDSFAALLQRHWDNPVVDRLTPFGYTWTTIDYNDGTHDNYHNLVWADPADAAFAAVITAVSTFNSVPGQTNKISVNKNDTTFRDTIGLYAAHQLLIDWTDLYSTRQSDNSPTILNLVGLAGGLDLQLTTLNLPPTPSGTTPHIVVGTHTPAISRLDWVSTWASDMLGTIDKTFVDMPTYGYENTADQLDIIIASSTWGAYSNAMIGLATNVGESVAAIAVPGKPTTTEPEERAATSEEAAAYAAALTAVITSHKPTIRILLNNIETANQVSWTVLKEHARRVTKQVERERVWWNWSFSRTNNVLVKKHPVTSGPFPDFTVIGLISKAASLSQSLDSVKSNPDLTTKLMFTEMHANPGNPSAAAVTKGLELPTP